MFDEQFLFKYKPLFVFLFLYTYDFKMLKYKKKLHVKNQRNSCVFILSKRRFIVQSLKETPRTMT